MLKLKSLGPSDEIIESGLLSKKLEGMYQGRKSKDPSRIIPIEHMLAAIAYPLADHINKNTKFGKAASEILNNAALVQIYTDTAVTGDTITITKLTAVYPSQTVTGVLLDASKVYFSTGGKGNFTFTILKNGATPNDVNPMDPVEVPGAVAKPTKAKVTAPDLDAVTQRKSSIQAAEPIDQPMGTEKSLGRKRRA